MADEQQQIVTSSLRPRRGKQATAAKLLTKANKSLLKSGELFLEYPDTGPGTGTGRIKMGDGVTDYGDLPYFLDTTGFLKEDKVKDINITFSETNVGDNNTLLNTIKSGNKLGIIIAAIKNLLSNLNKSLSSLSSKVNDNSGKISDLENKINSTPSGPSDSDLESIRNRLSKDEQNIQQNTSNISSMGSRLDKVESDIATIRNLISSGQGGSDAQLGQITSDISDIKKKNQEQDSRLDKIETKLNTGDPGQTFSLVPYNITRGKLINSNGSIVDDDLGQINSYYVLPNEDITWSYSSNNKGYNRNIYGNFSTDSSYNGSRSSVMSFTNGSYGQIETIANGVHYFHVGFNTSYITDLDVALVGIGLSGLVDIISRQFRYLTPGFMGSPVYPSQIIKYNVKKNFNITGGETGMKQIVLDKKPDGYSLFMIMNWESYSSKVDFYHCVTDDGKTLKCYFKNNASSDVNTDFVVKTVMVPSYQFNNKIIQILDGFN